jgi:hypothetical protein
MKDPYLKILEDIEKNHNQQMIHPLLIELKKGGLIYGEIIQNGRNITGINIGLLPLGRDRLKESRKSLIRKIFEKQPATSIQILVNLVCFIIGLIIGYLI